MLGYILCGGDPVHAEILVERRIPNINWKWEMRNYEKCLSVTSRF